MNTENPMLQYTRQEKLFIKLPSRGYYNDPNDLKLNESEELGIRAMTAADEISAKTPDALLNGESLIGMIENCVPSISDARKLTLPDSEALMLAIRIASYGETMEVSVNCPKCKHENIFDANLAYCLDDMTFLEKEYNVTLEESQLTVSLKPYTLSTQIRDTLSKFKENQLLKNMIDDDEKTEEEKQQYFLESVKELSDISFTLVSDCVISFLTPTGDILELSKDQLIEGIKGLSVRDARAIIKKVNEINAIGINNNVQAICTKCEHSWSSKLSYNPSDFFEIGSYS